MSKVFFAVGLLCALGCASAEKLVPKSPAEAAVLAVDTYEKADKAAMLACLAYKQGVYTGAIKASAEADAKCNSLVEDMVDEVVPEVEPTGTDIELLPVYPTDHFPGKRTVPA